MRLQADRLRPEQNKSLLEIADTVGVHIETSISSARVAGERVRGTDKREIGSSTGC